MKKINWLIPTGLGLVLLIAVHGILVAWYVKLSDKIGGWFPWIAGGALMAFGLYHLIRHTRKGHGHANVSEGHAHDDTEGERGPHDGFLVNLGHGFVEITIFGTEMPPRFRLFFFNQRKQVRSVPTRATAKIETVRPDGARQFFAFRAQGECLESTNDFPRPNKFKAILELSHGTLKHRHEVQFSGNDRAHDGWGKSEPATSGDSARTMTADQNIQKP
jgi:hypothetical protein